MKPLKMLKSFKFAIQGILELIKSENNARFHFLATILVLGFGWYFNTSSSEWMILLICISAVWSAEAFNSAIEKLCDIVIPNKNTEIGKIKDMAAAGVLFIAIAAAFIAAIIFVPKLMNL
jgi:diacylglycerol kinase